jgi:DNA-binding SARP family transcriptional activator
VGADRSATAEEVGHVGHGWNGRAVGERVTFRVLGPVGITRAEGAVRLPTGGVRVVLAMLVLHANQTVPVDRLVEALWGRDAPASARTQVQGFVSLLRRVLDTAIQPGAGADIIATSGAGYVLRVEPYDCDVTAFFAALAQARLALSRGDPHSAVRSMNEALAQWRGQACEDVTSRLLEAEADRLEQLRLSAAQECARIQLELGQLADALPPLVALVARHPLHERLRELLMLALYRSGQRAEALDQYRQVRKALVDELGIEPGPALRNLHLRMLRDDPDLHGGSLSAACTPPGRLAQLPADLADFTGHEAAVAQLLAVLDPAHRDRDARIAIAAITGMPGIGKTALAVHVAQLARRDFPDGQMYVDLGGARQPRSSRDVLTRLLRDLGADAADMPLDEDELAARYRSRLAERRMLIVLDDVYDAAQVRPLLTGTGGCAVLLTARYRIPELSGLYQLDLDVFTRAQARELFAGVVGAPRVDAEPEATDEVLAACGGLPLAVRIAAVRLQTRPNWRVRDLADRLADRSRRLDHLDVGDLAIRQRLRDSYRSLPAPVDPQAIAPARAFRLLGLAGTPTVSLSAAAALLDWPEAAVGEALGVLVDAHLLDEPGPGRYRFHDLVALYAAECAEADEPRQARDDAVERMLRWYRGDPLAQ